MRRRLLASLGALAFAMPMAGAQARTAMHTCPAQVTDPRGDAHDWMLPNHPALPEGDVLAVTLSPTKSTVAFTWHMAAVSTAPTRAIQLVVIFKLNQGRSYDVSIDHGVDGNSFQDAQWDETNNADVQGTLHNIGGSVDVGANTLTALVPLADLGISRAGAFYDFRGLAGEDVGISAASAGEIVDDYGNPKTYYLGKNHC